MFLSYIILNSQFFILICNVRVSLILQLLKVCFINIFTNIRQFLLLRFYKYCVNYISGPKVKNMTLNLEFF